VTAGADVERHLTGLGIAFARHEHLPVATAAGTICHRH
jgi:hypothetical protein